MDFYLNHPGNGYSTLMRDYQKDYRIKGEDNSFFKKDARERDINRFLAQYMRWYRDTRDIGYISMLTCNHDTVRPRFNLEPDELKLAYAFIFTMPGVPFLYYGDEIGMRYLDLPTKEGGYYRTGSRTPMQWDGTQNLGFSTGCADALYLPVDPCAGATTVAAQESDPESLLNITRAILALRRGEESLQADAPFEPLYAEPGKPFAYRRGDVILAVNPSGEAVNVPIGSSGKSPVFSIRQVSADADGIHMSGNHIYTSREMCA